MIVVSKLVFNNGFLRSVELIEFEPKKGNNFYFMVLNFAIATAPTNKKTVPTASLTLVTNESLEQQDLQHLHHLPVASGSPERISR